MQYVTVSYIVFLHLMEENVREELWFEAEKNFLNFKSIGRKENSDKSDR